MQLLHDRVLVSLITEEQITKSGLILPSKTKKYRTGVIQLIGKKVKVLKVGDTISIFDNVGVPINYRGDDLLIVSESKDVIATI